MNTNDANNLELIAMELISKGGEGRTLALSSIDHAMKGNIEKARELLKQSNSMISEGHKSIFSLLTAEANSENIVLSVLIVHALDHIMNALTIYDLAVLFVDNCAEKSGNQ